MSRDLNFNKVISSVGKTVTAHLPDGWCSGPYKALIQPLRYKNKMYLDGTYTDIGRNTSGYYLYIGPANHDISRLDETAYLVSGDVKYIISRAERCYLGERITHIWAILRNMEGEQ
ncbi:MAG: hypothetical protein IKY44_03225 [Clostridia bacterium]|nr:hypothetical protein [Clostridia bacterium]